jgi:NAD(P)-dependent dehydrogenase (short-subunit alcohol dehydrogenase family)
VKKTVIITGASGNLGRASVTIFLKEGYRVIATVSPNKTLDYEVNGDITVEEVDLSDESGVERFMKKYSSHDNTIDAALLLVGGFAMGNIENTDSAQINKMLKLNFFTAYNLAKRIFAKMKSQSSAGRIILVGSRPAIVPSEGKNVVAYALSKSLIFTLADLLNAESNSNKLVTNVIVPGIIDTEINRQSMPDANFDDWVTPEDIAENMVWLCSDKATSLRNTKLKVYGNLKN